MIEIKAIISLFRKRLLKGKILDKPIIFIALSDEFCSYLLSYLSRHDDIIDDIFKWNGCL